MQVERVEDQLKLFVQFAEKLGLPDHCLFDPATDLLELRDIPRVTRCLATMARQAEHPYVTEPLHQAAPSPQ